jgi:hypothetical protein
MTCGARLVIDSMPESRSRRFKQLELQIARVAPGKPEVFFMNVPRDQYDEATALLKDLRVGKAKSTDPVEAVEVQLEPEKVTEPSRKAQNDEPDEFSDRARLKHLRELSRAAERKDWHGETW